MAAGPVSEMRAEGEIKMLRESSCVSRSPRCGTVGAGPALLKGKPGRRARRGGNPGGSAPSLSLDVTSPPTLPGRGAGRRKFKRVQPPGCLGSGAGVGSKAHVGMKG